MLFGTVMLYVPFTTLAVPEGPVLLSNSMKATLVGIPYPVVTAVPEMVTVEGETVAEVCLNRNAAMTRRMTDRMIAATTFLFDRRSIARVAESIANSKKFK